MFPNKGQLWLAFALPVVLFGLICICLGVVPFGELDLLIRDMRGQYADYFSYYRSILRGENDLIYSFSKVLGGDMFSFAAYYLLSPFNLLFLLFDNADYALAVTLIMAMKLGASGLTASIFLRGTGKRDAWWLLMFSTGYALMSYNILYASNIMWLDGVIALPLVALGIHWLLEGKNPGLYILSLAYGLITNYYIGYMLCIFSVLYFLLHWLSGWRKASRKAWKALLCFAMGSLLAGALGAVVLLPTFLSLSGTKASFTPALLTMVKNFSLPALAERLFLGSVEYVDFDTGLPNIFCGLVSLLCAWLFFANRHISRRERGLSLAVVLVLLLSFWINAPNLIWHGFNPPICFPYRYSFILSFFAISLAWRGMQEPKAVRGGAWMVGIVVLLCLGLLVLAAVTGAALKPWELAANAIALMLAGLGLVFLLKDQWKNGGIALLALVQLFSLFANGLAIGGLDLREAEVYRRYVSTTEPLVEYVKANDEGFYRMEKSFYRSANDAMQFGYHGLTHFSSTNQLSARGLHASLGYYADIYVDYYGEGSTMAMDSLLGVKYLLHNQRECLRPYEPFGASDAIAIFRNPYALELLMPVAAEAAEAEPDGASVFGRQNGIYRAASGLQEDIFTAVEGLELSGENVEILQTERFLRLDRIDPQQDAVLTIRFTAPNDGLVYACFQAASLRELSISSGGRTWGNEGLLSGEILCLGSGAAGETAELVLRLSEDSLTLNRWEIFSENEDVLAAHIGVLRENAGTVERIRSSRLRWQGRIGEGQGALLLTVPYDDNWTAYVDGEERETSSLLGGFVGVALEEGEHRVELRYEAEGLKTGALISAAALLIVSAWLLYRSQQEKKESR